MEKIEKQLKMQQKQGPPVISSSELHGYGSRYNNFDMHEFVKEYQQEQQEHHTDNNFSESDDFHYNNSVEVGFINKPQ